MSFSPGIKMSRNLKTRQKIYKNAFSIRQIHLTCVTISFTDQKRCVLSFFSKHADGERQTMYITEIFYSQRSIAKTSTWLFTID